MINNLSNLIIPLMILIVVLYGIKKKINVYDSFIEGTKESFDIIITTFPYLLGMILSINIFVNSGFLSSFLELLNPIFSFFKIPVDIIPLGVMRSISGNSSLALLNNIFATNGPDSFIGKLGSIVQGSTDTTLYVITLYFGSIGIKKTRYAVFAGIMADIFALIISIMICNLIFN